MSANMSCGGAAAASGISAKRSSAIRAPKDQCRAVEASELRQDVKRGSAQSPLDSVEPPVLPLKKPFNEAEKHVERTKTAVRLSNSIDGGFTARQQTEKHRSTTKEPPVSAKTADLKPHEIHGAVRLALKYIF